MTKDRSRVVSSFTIVKGTLLDETTAAFAAWNFDQTKAENLQRIKADNLVAARSANWLREVILGLNRRFDPSGRDRPLVSLVHAGVDREIWKPLLLWHMTRDEFLVRDFLVNWLYPRFQEGVYSLHTLDLIPYLKSLEGRKDIDCKGGWTDSTTQRVACSLLHIATDIGLLRGSVSHKFESFHLPENSFLYLLYAMVDLGWNTRHILHADDWRMYLMGPDDVERELLRLHQYRRLHYEVAGSLAQLKLPLGSLAEFATELTR